MTGRPARGPFEREREREFALRATWPDSRDFFNDFYMDLFVCTSKNEGTRFEENFAFQWIHLDFVGIGRREKGLVRRNSIIS